MEKERGVILEELAMVADSPPQLADLLLDSILFPGNPLGRDIAGTPESVAGIDGGMIKRYLGEQYAPGNTVVAVAGNVTHDEIVEKISEAMGSWRRGAPGDWARLDGVKPSRRFALHYKKTEQAHVTIAVPGIPLNHPDRHALSFLSVILGEGMSSRLFIELREKRGLVYDVHTYVAHFMDAGTFNIYTGVDPKKAAEALRVILTEFSRLNDGGVTEAELTKARELSKGRLLLRMEDSRNVSGWIGAQELLLENVRSIDDAVAEMDSVTIEDVNRVARELIDPKKAHLAVVGPYRSEKRFAGVLP
jgi:predicted Zn-dependent peptidase